MMKFRLLEDARLRKRADTMTIRELLYTVCCPSVNAEQPDPKIPCDCIFLHKTTKELAKACIPKLRRYNSGDPIVVADIECGSGAAIQGCVRFPSMYALAKANDPSIAYDVGRAAAKDALEAGYKWSLAPCVDLLLNPDSPMASLRTAGGDPNTVSRICGAYMQGMQDGGLVATVKHFPGDGATVYDQHLTTPENPLSEQEWLDTYGRIYQDMIDQGVMAVMPGHIALPCLDEKDPQLELYPPATLSYNLMTGLLKERMGFEGIIISDAVEMGGFCGFMNYYRACATFLKNGGDVLLFANPDDRFIRELTACVQSGELPEPTLRLRAYRVLCFMQQARAMRPKSAFTADLQALSDSVVQKSIAVVRDRARLLPLRLKRDANILHAVIMNDYQNHTVYNDLQQELSKHSNHVTLLCDPGPQTLTNQIKTGGYDLVICSVGTPTGYGTNVIRLHGPMARNMMGGWTKLGTPVVFVNFYHPYFHLEYQAQADTVINTCGVADATCKTVVNRLFQF